MALGGVTWTSAIMPQSTQPPKFYQRHYQVLAEMIRGFSYISDTNRAQIIVDFARKFKQDNPKFKPKLFFESCGLEEGQAIILTEVLSREHT